MILSKCFTQEVDMSWRRFIVSLMFRLHKFETQQIYTSQYFTSTVKIVEKGDSKVTDRLLEKILNPVKDLSLYRPFV